MEGRRPHRDDRARSRLLRTGTANGLPNVLVFEPLAKNQKASWLANDSVPHSYTYTADAARSLVTLAENESAWNQTWHVATTPNPPTGEEFVAVAAKELGVALRYHVLTKPMVRLIGWFNPLVGEVYEMLYQNDSPYLFDSSKSREPLVSPARLMPKEFAPPLPLSRKLPHRRGREGLPVPVQH